MYHTDFICNSPKLWIVKILDFFFDYQCHEVVRNVQMRYGERKTIILKYGSTCIHTIQINFELHFFFPTDLRLS